LKWLGRNGVRLSAIVFFSLAFVVPAFLMILFGYGISLDVENIPFVVVDNDGSSMSRELLARYLSRTRGTTLEQAQRIVQPVKLETRYLYNQSLKSIWSVAPKLIMVIMMLSPPFLTALGVVREKESGSIYNIYASTIRRGEFLLGKLAPYVAISTMNMLILWLTATQMYGAPFKGQVAFFTLASILYVICTTGIGLVASVFVKTQIAAMIVTIILTMVPAVLYSGMLIPIASLSGQAQVIAHILPAMYYTNIVTGTFLKGVGLNSLWPNVLILAAYAIVLFTIGFTLFSKRPRS